ncbi:MAG: sugar phosphate isomerase/epimerase [Deltaproteobacteria bacterium]|nr:sugar phosphate isomerase/epimerase [Deltaproteobacteria bacterium]MBM4322354.1 sugar phosphate isomerase/epimerase [Deltaproteobacteria bacterium]
MLPIHINVPYPMLVERIEFVINHHFHPEIYFSGEDLDGSNEAEVKQLAENLHGKDLTCTVHGPFMDLSPGGVDRRIREVTLDRISKTIELASLFKPKAIVFHPGYEKWKFDGEVGLWLESSLRTWKPLVEEVKERGLTIAIENVYEENPDSLLMLLKEIHSPHFRFCFDTGHHNVFGKTPLPLWMEQLGEYLVEVHLHDNLGEMDEHLPVGEGSFDFRELFTLFSRWGLNPIYTIEPHQEDHLWRGLEAIKQYIPVVE